MKFCIAWENEDIKGRQEVRVCELNDDGVYAIEYQGSGKREVIRSLDFRFELLFEVGAYALLDCYYREAVSSFTAALERFYEFYVEVCLRSSGLDSDQYGVCWKHLKSASERQLGAFVGVYAMTRKKCPDLLSGRWREFRNNVTHRGMIPLKEQALEYGDEVGKLILADMTYLLQGHRPMVAAVFSRQLEAANAKIPAESELRVDRLSTVYLARVLSHRDTSSEVDTWSLEEQLKLITPIWLNASSRFYGNRISELGGRSA